MKAAGVLVILGFVGGIFGASALPKWAVEMAERVKKLHEDAEVMTDELLDLSVDEERDVDSAALALAQLHDLVVKRICSRLRSHLKDGALTTVERIRLTRTIRLFGEVGGPATDAHVSLLLPYVLVRSERCLYTQSDAFVRDPRDDLARYEAVVILAECGKWRPVLDLIAEGHDPQLFGQDVFRGSTGRTEASQEEREGWTRTRWPYHMAYILQECLGYDAALRELTSRIEKERRVPHKQLNNRGIAALEEVLRALIFDSRMKFMRPPG